MTSRFTRRRWLKTGATIGAGAAVAGIIRPRSAHAGWGRWPEDKLGSMVPESKRARSVLDVHLYGGVNAFDTFYTVPDWGQADDRFLYAYWADTQARFGACGFTGGISEYFADDANGVPVHLGPWITPIRMRPDIVQRMRVLVTRHDQLAHPGANPLALGGHRLGSPRLAGISASVQRHFSELEGPDTGRRAAPYAWVLYPGVEFATDNVRSASALGLHPGSATPMSLRVATNSELTQLLSRPGTGGHRQAFDAAMDLYGAQLRKRLTPRGLGTPVRAPVRDDFFAADAARRQSDVIASLLPDSLFTAIPDATCGDGGDSMPRLQARLAAALLRRPTDAPRYVQWIDGGMFPNPNGGHDTHIDHVNDASRNVSHSMQALVDVINAPGENDPGKIDLDETMIVLTTEFGRTPHRQDPNGLNHWPQGYVTIVIGGPIQAGANGAQSIYGAVDPASGEAMEFITPAETRMMVLSALGIWPFEAESFAVGDVPLADDEHEGAIFVARRALGLEEVGT